jgi:flavin-binding protein dodecin
MEPYMGTIAKISEISCQSTKSFEDAITTGIARANKTLRQIESAWVKEMKVAVEGGNVKAYQVNLLVTFVLDE